MKSPLKNTELIGRKKITTGWKKITGKSEWKKGNIFPILEVRKNMSGFYQVDLFRGSGATTIIGVFKTKTKALAYANAYMRKH